MDVEDLVSKMNEEFINAMAVGEGLAKGTRLEPILIGYVRGIHFCIRLVRRENPPSIVPSFDELMAELKK